METNTNEKQIKYKKEDEKSVKKAILGALATIGLICGGTGYLVGRLIVKTYAHREQKTDEENEQAENVNVMEAFKDDLFGGEEIKPTHKVLDDVTLTKVETLNDGSKQVKKIVKPGYSQFKRRVDKEGKPAEIAEPHIRRGTTGKIKNPLGNTENLRIGLKNARWAFLCGTILACSAFAFGTYATCHFMDVWSIQDFSRRMRQIIPDALNKNNTVPGAAANVAKTMSNKFKGTILQKHLSKIEEDDEDEIITDEEIEQTLEDFFDTEVDLRDVIPFLSIFYPKTEEEREADRIAEAALNIQIESELTALDIPELETVEPSTISKTTVNIAEKPDNTNTTEALSWGEWTYETFWTPYYYVVGK